MATAKQRTYTETVTTLVEKTDGVTLELTRKEAEVLRAILGNCASYARYNESASACQDINDALTAAGFSYQVGIAKVAYQSSNVSFL